jgi:hypothetical protein
MEIHENPWKSMKIENPMLPCEHPMNQVDDAGIFISPILGLLCFNLAWWWDHHKSTICAADGNSRIRCAHIQANRRCLLEASRMARSA